MGFFSLIMLEIALELARNDSTYVDMANKFLEHFMHISAAINGKNGMIPKNYDHDEFLKK